MNKYRITKNGVVNSIFSGQRHASKLRHHSLPTYTLDELRVWCFAQDKFHILYDRWVKSGYERDFKPSVDRIDYRKSYTFDNIQLMTCKENVDKGFREITGRSMWEANKRPVQKIHNGKVIKNLGSIIEAAEDVGVTMQVIHKAIKNNWKSGGFNWRYAPILTALKGGNK